MVIKWLTLYGKEGCYDNFRDLVKEMCQKQDVSIAVLAKELRQSQQNFYKKLQRDTLTLTELKEIANVL